MSKGNNQFFLGRDVAQSEGFRTLSQAAIIIYLDFSMRCRVKKLNTKPGRKKEWVVRNNGELEYTYAEALSKGITRPRFKRALKELVEKGFIDITHSGMGGRKGDKSLYAISERWRAWGTDKFIEAIMPKDNRKGRGFARYWEKKKAIIGNTGVTPISKVGVTPTDNKRGIGVTEMKRHKKAANR